MELKERPAYVEFEVRADEDRGASIEEGRTIFKDVIYAIITPSGGNLVVEKIADEWVQSKRDDPFYRHYRDSLEAFKEGREAPVEGTAIENCPPFSPAQVKQIRAAQLRTVEDLAAANESSLGKMGMGGRALKDRAIEWLKSAEDVGKVAEQSAALKATVDNQAEVIKQLEEKIEKLEADRPKSPRPKKKAA